jgi:hypothetical protein
MVALFVGFLQKGTQVSSRDLKLLMLEFAAKQRLVKQDGTATNLSRLRDVSTYLWLVAGTFYFLFGSQAKPDP